MQISIINGISVVCFLLIGLVHAGNAGNEAEEKLTELELTKNYAFHDIHELRQVNGILPNLIYDPVLEAKAVQKAAGRCFMDGIVGKANTNNKDFCTAVNNKWTADFEAYMWATGNSTTETDEAAQKILYTISSSTERVFLKFDLTKNGGIFGKNEYKAVVFFSPLIPSETIKSAITIKYIDALHLLNSCRNRFRSSPLAFNPSKTKLANQLLLNFKTLIRQHHESNSPYQLTLEGNDGTFSFFAYKLPEEAKAEDFIFKFPYAAIKQLVFGDYIKSLTEFRTNSLLYTQIRRELYLLMNQSILDVGMAYDTFEHKKHRYSLFVMYLGEPMTFNDSNLATLDKIANCYLFNFETVSSSSERIESIQDYIKEIPELNFAQNLVRFKPAFLRK